jgi:signal transduction histidine kinase
MSLMLRLQAGAILGSIGPNIWLFCALADDVPAPSWWAALILITGFYLWWAASIIWYRLNRTVSPDSPDRWFGHTIAVFWAGNLTVGAVFWLLMPHASEAIRMLVVFFTTAPVAVEAMGSVRPPRFGPRGPWATRAPVGLPAIEILFFLTHPTPLALPVLLLWPPLLATLLLLRENLQRSLVRSHDLRLEAERARDARTRFLAAASHDLGQPLQSARLFLDQALRSPEPQKRARAGENARDALGAMERLLNQMLDQLRLDAGAVQPRSRSITASEPIAHVAAQFGPAAALAGIELIAAPSRIALSADTDMLERALGNLVDNALRHGRGRRVLIGARRRGAAARFWVIDDGVGVPPAEAGTLFDDYVQGAGAGGGARGGFGLGLGSVRRMAELMGGRAGLDPGWCKGAAFFIDLPLEGAERAPA